MRRFPQNVAKYCGCYRERGTKFEVAIVTKDVKFYKNVDTYDAVLDLLREKNLELGLPIKNMIHDMETHYEVEVGNGYRTKIDKEDLPIIEAHVWSVDKHESGCYVRTTIEEKNVKLHNLIMKHKPGDKTVDHKNHDGLDNMKINLRITDLQTQVLNRRTFKNNKSGKTGVFFNKRKSGNLWRVIWTDADGKLKYKSFSVNAYGSDEAKQKAIDYKNKIEREVPHYRKALFDE